MEHNVIRKFVTKIAERDRSARRVSEPGDVVRAIEAYLQARSTALGENHLVPADEMEEALQVYHTVRQASAKSTRPYQPHLFQGAHHGRSHRV